MKRFWILFFFALLFIAFVLVWNKSFHNVDEDSYVPVPTADPYHTLPIEQGVFSGSDLGLEYAVMPVDSAYQRSLETYYDNRAFDGAPPSIPHPVSKERSAGGISCLQCHQSGGFVEKFNAYAPITPHPEMVSCRQCHVVQNTNTVFKPTNFTGKKPAMVGVNNAMAGSPPVIPHHIQMRENCLACHAGPASPKEIRTTHPHRVNCMQCHVLQKANVTPVGLTNTQMTAQ